MTKDKYFVRSDGESLTARLIEIPRLTRVDQQIEITYVNSRGESQTAVYQDGTEIILKAREISRSGFLFGNTSYLPGYFNAYKRLGPELREQIPPEWHPALGDWLKPKA